MSCDGGSRRGQGEDVENARCNGTSFLHKAIQTDCLALQLQLHVILNHYKKLIDSGNRKNMAAPTGSSPPALFKPFRALGYITDNVPFAVQRRGKETFVTTSVGKNFQVTVIWGLPAQLWVAVCLI